MKLITCAMIAFMGFAALSAARQMRTVRTEHIAWLLDRRAYWLSIGDQEHIAHLSASIARWRTAWRVIVEAVIALIGVSLVVAGVVLAVSP